jgi:hypothetical protein
MFMDTCIIIQGVPLATRPGISLITLKLIKILQRNLNRNMFLCEKCYIITCAGSGHHLRPYRIDGIIKEMPGLIASETSCINRIEITNKMRPCSRTYYSNVS